MGRYGKIAAGVMGALVVSCVFWGSWQSIRLGGSLREMHAYGTELHFEQPNREPAPEPPAELFELVNYPAPLGDNAAYVSRHDPAELAPGIVWIVGGFDWSIGEEAWGRYPRSNDQSARAFREAGVVLMLPSLRGCNDNPGQTECFFGEVEDIIAAVDFLAGQPGVDPARVYLGGHSTGATLVLLAAALGGRMKGVFSLDPIDDPIQYGEVGCLEGYEAVSMAESIARAPMNFVSEIRVPTWIISTSSGFGEADYGLSRMAGAAPVSGITLEGFDHFSMVAPTTEAIAKQILRDGSDIWLGSDQIARIDEEARSAEDARVQAILAELEELDGDLEERDADLEAELPVQRPEPESEPLVVSGDLDDPLFSVRTFRTSGSRATHAVLIEKLGRWREEFGCEVESASRTDVTLRFTRASLELESLISELVAMDPDVISEGRAGFMRSSGQNARTGLPVSVEGVDVASVEGRRQLLARWITAERTVFVDLDAERD